MVRENEGEIGRMRALGAWHSKESGFNQKAMTGTD